MCLHVNVFSALSFAKLMHRNISSPICEFSKASDTKHWKVEMRTLVDGFLKMHEKFPMPIADVEVGDTLLHEGAQ